MTALVLFMLYHERANSVCPAWSLRMIRSCGLGHVPSRRLHRRQVGALHFEWEILDPPTVCVHECIAHLASRCSTHLPCGSPCVQQAGPPQTRILGCLLQQMPASSLAIGMMLLHHHATTFHRSCQASCLLVSSPLETWRSAHTLRSTSPRVACLVPASQPVLHQCLADLSARPGSSLVRRRSTFQPFFISSSQVSSNTVPSPCLYPWLPFARW